MSIVQPPSTSALPPAIPTPSSSRRTSVDHLISLVDNSHPKPGPTSSDGPSETASAAHSPSASTPTSPTSPLHSRTSSDAFLSRKRTLREELARRKYTKYQEARYSRKYGAQGVESGTDDEIDADQQSQAESQGDGRTSRARSSRAEPKEVYEVDILYENQRGYVPEMFSPISI
jgi:hypothetical protein